MTFGTQRKHGAVFVKALAENLLEQGYSKEQVFENSAFGDSLLKEDKPVADFSDIAAFFEHAAELTGNSALGFQHGIVRDGRRVGLLLYVGLASPTVTDFIKNVVRYRRVFTDALDMNADRLESEGVLTWRFRVPSNVNRRQFVEFGASGILASLRQASQHEIHLKHAAFRHSRNTDIDVIQNYLGCRPQFGTSENSFTFDPFDLSRPLVTADNELYAILTQYADEVLQRKARVASDLIVDVERVIADRLSAGDANQSNVSRALGMSPRTLARRLAQEKTTFFKTQEDLRKTLAVSYLKDSDLSLGEIAFLLGYSSISSFSEAFKRWMGQPPGQFRLT